MVNDIPNIQGKIDDLKKLFEPIDMHLKLKDEVKHNNANDIDQLRQVSRKATAQIK